MQFLYLCPSPRKQPMRSVQSYNSLPCNFITFSIFTARSGIMIMYFYVLTKFYYNLYINTLMVRVNSGGMCKASMHKYMMVKIGVKQINVD